MFIHELKDAAALYNSIGDELQVIPQIVEKDYWLMHCLWGLKDSGLSFELKGGTSLSKGYGLIHRFSEDVDIKSLWKGMFNSLYMSDLINTW